LNERNLPFSVSHEKRIHIHIYQDKENGGNLSTHTEERVSVEMH